MANENKYISDLNREINNIRKKVKLQESNTDASATENHEYMTGILKGLRLARSLWYVNHPD